MDKHIHSLIRPMYWSIRRKVLNNSIVSKYLLNRFIAGSCNDEICPICKSNLIQKIHFYFEREDIVKYYCKECHHIFTNNLRADIKKGFQLFHYENENEHLKDQKYLLLQLEKHTRVTAAEKRRLLDFGIGGNYSHLLELNSCFSEVIFEGCDIYPKDAKFYFQSYSDKCQLHVYDGISSNAVIEHLDDTMNSWKYLNRLLKPLNEGGGIMVHAFPSQITEDYLHWTIQIKSHECLFSKQSLLLVCSETGFELIKIESARFAQHPLYYFKKVRNM